MSDITPQPPKEIQILPDESPHTIGTYFRAVFQEAWMKAGTLIGAVLLAAISILAGVEARWAAGAVLLIYLFVICFQTWKSERQRSDSLNLQIQAMKYEALRDYPLLDGYIRNISAENWFDAKTKQLLGVRLCIGITFMNRNQQPAGSLNFGVESTSATGVYKVPTTKKYRPIGNLTVNSAAKYLPNYFAIPTNQTRLGIPVEGLIVFEARGMSLSESVAPTTKHIVTVTDAYGRKHYIQKWDNPRYDVDMCFLHLDDQLTSEEIAQLSAKIGKK